MVMRARRRTEGPRARGPWLARVLVRVAAWLAPARVRAQWRAEWEAELWHESRRTDGTHGRLVLSALGSFRDALAMHELKGAGSIRPSYRHFEHWGPGMLREATLIVRGLRRSPVFTVITVLTLALGLGANAALFTVIHAVLLRPLPYADAERLVRIEHPVPAFDENAPWPLSMHGFFHVQDHNRTLEGIGIYLPGAVNLAGEEAPPERALSAVVSASLFAVLRARPHHGRLFTPADNAPGSAPVVVLGYDFWQRRYGGDPSIVGRRIRVNGIEREVVGIAARGLHLPNATTDLWSPLWLDRSQPATNSHNFGAIGRLRAGVTVEAASADMARLTAQFPEALAAAYTPGFMARFGFTGSAQPLHSSLVGGAARGLWIVFGAVGLVLLIACANVANLFLVRTEGRRREVAVRTALGATRVHLARFFLAESVLLALASGVLAIVIAASGLRLLLALAPSAVPRLTEITLGPLTLLFTIAVALLAGIGLGLFPLLRLPDAGSTRAMQEGTTRQTMTRSGQRVRAILVGAQIAFALVLLAGAGLLVQSFDRLRAVRSGFHAEGLLTFEVALSRTYDTPERWNGFYQQFLEQVRALPGVTAAGGTTSFPLKDVRGCWALTVPDAPLQPGDPPRCIPVVFVTPGYFAALGIPIEGREYEWRDNAAFGNGAIVSRPLAQRFWPERSALGRPIGLGDASAGSLSRIVGIAAPVRATALTEPATEIAYFPIVPNARDRWWNPPLLMTIAVRSTRPNPPDLLPEIRRALANVDPDVPIANVRTADEIALRSLARVTFVMFLIGIAAGLALLLGSIGLYGVIAYVVGQRRAEIGIRLALGARIAQVARLVVWQSLRIALAGVLVGVLVALLVTRVLQSLLFEVSPTDPLTLVGVSAILLTVAVAAAGAPALRAARVDPAETLR
jgi:predicted permease